VKLNHGHWERGRVGQVDSQRAWLTDAIFHWSFSAPRRRAKSGKQRHHQWTTGRSFKPGDVAIDPLARRRDRLTAIGRRRGIIAKKKSAKKNRMRRWRAGG
jgi:hypothetical protein